MAKKDFTGGMDALINGIKNPPPSTPQAEEHNETPTPEEVAAPKKKRGRGRPKAAEQGQRTTIIVKPTIMEDIKAISYKRSWEAGKKISYTDVIQEALLEYIQKNKRK